MRRLVLVVALAPVALLGSSACKKDEPAKRAQGVAAPAGDPCAKAKPEGPIAWFHDDYAGALACAKHERVPLVLDLWAPWCHTCLSMQSTVFMDPSFAPVASKFVFAALDTDREVNAAAVEQFALAVWPTFYVVDHDEAVLARFVGAASVSQFHAFLADGARAMAGGAAGADAHLLAAERAAAQEDHATADTELTAALAAAPASWPRRQDALVSLITAKQKRRDHAGCVELAEKALDDTGSSASATDFLYRAMACADEVAKENTDPAVLVRVTRLRERAVVRLRKLVEDPAAPLSVDDRSDAMLNLREALLALGQQDAAKALAEQQRALLDDAAAKATTPMAEMTFIWPRAEVYVFLGRPLDLVPSLEKLAAQLPAEYDPPVRLGWVYLKAGKLDEAATWTDRAIRLAYGPRKVRMLTQRAEIASKQGDVAGERKAREQIVQTLEALPPGQAQPDALAKAKKKLAELAASSSGGSGAPPAAK